MVPVKGGSPLTPGEGRKNIVSLDKESRELEEALQSLEETVNRLRLCSFKLLATLVDNEVNYYCSKCGYQHYRRSEIGKKHLQYEVTAAEIRKILPNISKFNFQKRGEDRSTSPQVQDEWEYKEVEEDNP